MIANLTLTSPKFSDDSIFIAASNKKDMFTPITDAVKQKLFYTPRPSMKKLDKRTSFIPSFPLLPSSEIPSKDLKESESLQRITLILTKYQRYIRKTKCIVPSWSDDDSESEEEDSSTESESQSDSKGKSEEEIDEEEAMNLAIYQKMAYGNEELVEQIKKNQVYNWINKDLSKNYSEGRLLSDYLHLLQAHADEFEAIHNHLSNAIEKEIRPNDDFQAVYINYAATDANTENIEINIESLLNEIQLHFAGIFDAQFYQNKYEKIEQIGSGVEGIVNKVALRKQSFDDIDEDEKEKEENAKYYAAKVIDYNERVMNNYRVMAKHGILSDFEMYIDKDNDKLILVSELWDCDVLQFMKREKKCFNESEVYDLAMQIIDLLFKLHSNHYIHGDIKPNNFVMNVSSSVDSDKNEFGLIDFGTMLKMKQHSETVRASMIGSIGYHSPEIVTKSYKGSVQIDSKVDVWAFGLSLIYLLNGTHPLMTEDLNILGEKRTRMKIKKCLDQMVKQNKISNIFCDLLMNMLQFDPLKRFNLWQIKSHRWITKKNVDEMTHSILFLDIDGVLNEKRTRPRNIEPHLMMKLKKIINETQCFVVLSSSWRRVPELKKKFKTVFTKIARLDIGRIYIGDTPNNGKNPTRAHEIMQYFERNQDKKDWRFCIVDDMDLVNENAAFSKEIKKFIDGHWVQTKVETGLNDENVKQIVNILNGE